MIAHNLQPGPQLRILTKLALPILLALLAAIATTTAAADSNTVPALLAARTVDQFERNTGIFPGFRRNHAKGICITGSFRGNGNATGYSKAPEFKHGTRTPVIGRLSIPGTNPYAWDSSTPIRGMALQLTRPDGSQWRMAMNAVPAFPVATPAANFAFLQAQQPVAATGNPDPHKLAAFFASHPHAAAFRHWVQTTPPPASFAGVSYNSLNTFILVNRNDHKRAVRWRMEPVRPIDGNNSAVSPDAPNYLAIDLQQRLAQGPLRWQFIITPANPGDSINNAAIAWIGPHQHINAGTLTIRTSHPQATGRCRDINFNPLVLPKGIQPSADPLLQYRDRAYRISHQRRVAERSNAQGNPTSNDAYTNDE